MQTTAEPYTAQDRVSANDSYGETKQIEGVSVRDESVRYRTKDSYRLEPVAVRAAEDLLRGSLMLPDSLQIKDCVVSDCTDDGDRTFYTVSFFASYAVDSGERIESGSHYSIGVNKADETTFDASNESRVVLQKYSIFERAHETAGFPADTNDSAAYVSAAKQIAASRFKHPDSGKVISAEPRPDASDDTIAVWDVLCEGENDFGLTIPDIYTAYLVYEDGIIREYDPDANIFS